MGAALASATPSRLEVNHDNHKSIVILIIIILISIRHTYNHKHTTNNTSINSNNSDNRLLANLGETPQRWERLRARETTSNCYCDPSTALCVYIYIYIYGERERERERLREREIREWYIYIYIYVWLFICACMHSSPTWESVRSHCFSSSRTCVRTSPRAAYTIQ